MITRIALACLLAGVVALFGAETDTPQTHTLHSGDPVPVVVWNRTITHIRIGWEDLSVEERADAIEKRISEIPEAALTQTITAVDATINGFSGLMFYAGGRPLFGLAHEDFLDPSDDIEAVRTQTIANIQAVFDARLDQRRPDILFWGSIWVLVATFLLVVVLVVVHRIVRKALATLQRATLRLPRIAGIDLTPACFALGRLGIKAPAFLLVSFTLYTWVTFSLGRFPLTQPLAQSLGHWLFAHLHALGIGVVSCLPGLFTVCVIVIITRMVARGLDSFFGSVESGALEISWMQPETAKATRRIAGMLIWLFAVTLAYPYIPGSSSDAFKGVSVFAGLLLTLGSAGMVNQVMSGLVVVYSRMMKPGDMVKVGDVGGVVTELGFLSTKVRTARGHEITMPNAIIVTSSVSNFSRFDPVQGPTIATTVTIGYDTPWRQVHALLTLAAQQTPGIATRVKPDILQTALSDWYVEYELRCVIERVEERFRVLSTLHASIQDAFNEHGVQIMSPHFVAQPAANVVVPKGQWSPPPASDTSLTEVTTV